MPAAPLSTIPPDPVPNLPKILGWPRVALIVILSIGSSLTHLESPTPLPIWLARNLTVCLFAVLAFGIFERWPRTLPRWAPRSMLQIVGAVLAGCLGAALAYAAQGGGDLFGVLQHRGYRRGFFSLILPVVVLAPPLAYVSILRRRESIAREQATRLQVERSDLQRQAADTRLRLLQAQVQPHFLFNTLANIRALVNAGSPRGVQVMDSLIAYLRASVPRLQQVEGTVGQELDLVRAYLELMQMRMPDRLHFAVDADAAALGLRCPPMALLTLVENAVRHGIDPSEEGGRINVTVRLDNGRCIATVVDTGVGLQDAGAGGSGLATLRERMKLAFGEAQLRLASDDPRGTRAVLEFPAVEVAR